MKSKKAFSIIEVVLVLAIVGLIFLMVFLIIPAARRAQRNQERKNLLSTYYAAVQQYQANNHKKLPVNSTTGWDERFITHYIDDGCEEVRISEAAIRCMSSTSDKFRDPDGELYQFWNTSGFLTSGNMKYNRSNWPSKIGSEPNTHSILLITENVCADVSDEVVYTGKRTDFSFMMLLEGSGVVCMSS